MGFEPAPAVARYITDCLYCTETTKKVKEAVVVEQWIDQLLLTPEDTGSNPVSRNFYRTVTYRYIVIY